MIKPKVLILSAGRGSRMYPFTLYRPIALCPVANIPLLERILAQVQAAGIDSAVLAFPSRAFAMTDLALATATPGFHLGVHFPDDPARGQVGNVCEAVLDFEGPALVIYGDSFLKADFSKLISNHEMNRAKGGQATLFYHRPKDLRSIESDARTYHGVMSVDESGRVRRFVEKPPVDQIAPGFDLANAAVFILEKALLEIPRFQNAKNFSFDIFEPAVRDGIPIYGCDIEPGFRYDAGRIARWHDLNMMVIRKEILAPICGSEIRPSVWVEGELDLLTTRINPPVVIGGSVQLEAGVELGPDVTIGRHCMIGRGASIKCSVIMDNCVIGAGAKLEHCLIGPHSSVAKGTELLSHTVLGAYSIVGHSSWPNWTEQISADCLERHPGEERRA